MKIISESNLCEKPTHNSYLIHCIEESGNRPMVLFVDVPSFDWTIGWIDRDEIFRDGQFNRSKIRPTTLSLEVTKDSVEEDNSFNQDEVYGKEKLEARIVVLTITLSTLCIAISMVFS